MNKKKTKKYYAGIPRERNSGIFNGFERNFGQNPKSILFGLSQLIVHNLHSLYFYLTKKSRKYLHFGLFLPKDISNQKVYISGMTKTQGAKDDSFVKINKGGGCVGQEGHAICMRKGCGCH